MKQLKYISIVISIIICTISCQTFDEVQVLFENSMPDEFALENDFVTTEGQTVLGNVIDIPYSIENLLKAYENLPDQTKSQIDPDTIKPTHYYVRFYPKSIAELDILRNIKPYVFLSEIPLDRKIEIGGSFYHDSSIPDNLPTYQYTVIPVSRWSELKRSVPVESEILIKAYIPDYDEAYTTKSEEEYGIPTAAYNALLREAYKITGNDLPNLQTKSGSWTPNGRIRAFDDKTSTLLPVPGVRVRASHLLKVKETLTDIQGRFSLPSFNNSVSYKIVWESDEWDIRDGLIGQATFDGPTSSAQWFPEIGTGHEKNVRYAAIQRAAYRWFHGDNDGLLRPAFSDKLKICQRVDTNLYPGMFSNANAMGWHIEIWIRDTTEQYRSIHSIYDCAAHEIGHASHYSHVSSYNSYCQSIKESWALFVEGVLYQKEYGVFPHNYITSQESWPGITPIEYSPIFIDLYDNTNQHTFDPSTPKDEVSGYSAMLLNGILINGSTSLDNLQRNLYPLPVGVTKDQVDTLFSYYITNWNE